MIPALVSRSRIFMFKPLTEEDLGALFDRALSDPQRGYGARSIQVSPEARQHLLRMSNGDARSLLNALELAVESTKPGADGLIDIDLQAAQDSIQQRAIHYDKNMDEHYDTISAFIKSVRGSDPDAALYWLAKMLNAGEDPRFILRRLLILAGEDIGLADPQALQVAASGRLRFRIRRPAGRHLSHHGSHPLPGYRPQIQFGRSLFRGRQTDRAGRRQTGSHPFDGCQPRRQRFRSRQGLPVPA